MQRRRLVSEFHLGKFDSSCDAAAPSLRLGVSGWPLSRIRAPSPPQRGSGEARTRFFLPFQTRRREETAFLPVSPPPSFSQQFPSFIVLRASVGSQPPLETCCETKEAPCCDTRCCCCGGGSGGDFLFFFFFKTFLFIFPLKSTPLQAVAVAQVIKTHLDSVSISADWAACGRREGADPSETKVIRCRAPAGGGGVKEKVRRNKDVK